MKSYLRTRKYNSFPIKSKLNQYFKLSFESVPDKSLITAIFLAGIATIAHKPSLASPHYIIYGFCLKFPLCFVALDSY